MFIRVMSCISECVHLCRLCLRLAFQGFLAQAQSNNNQSKNCIENANKFKCFVGTWQFSARNLLFSHILRLNLDDVQLLSWQMTKRQHVQFSSTRDGHVIYNVPTLSTPPWCINPSTLWNVWLYIPAIHTIYFPSPFIHSPWVHYIFLLPFIHSLYLYTLPLYIIYSLSPLYISSAFIHCLCTLYIPAHLYTFPLPLYMYCLRTLYIPALLYTFPPPLYIASAHYIFPLPFIHSSSLYTLASVLYIIYIYITVCSSRGWVA